MWALLAERGLANEFQSDAISLPTLKFKTVCHTLGTISDVQLFAGLLSPSKLLYLR